jgi:hypothetical protein
MITLESTIANAALVRGDVLPVVRNVELDGVWWLYVKITGWDDVKKHCRKTFDYEGRTYGWSCWDSDRMVSVFRSPPFPHVEVKRQTRKETA